MTVSKLIHHPKYKAVIFDLDGTLLNTLDDMAESMNAALAEFGFPPHSLDEYKYMVGHGLRPLVERALPATKRTPLLIKQVEQRLRAIYQHRWDKKTRLYPGIAELLDKLIRAKISLNILSNKPHEYTVIVVNKFLNRWPFNIVLGQRKDLPKKPAPDGALFIARQLGLPPGKIIYLGDTSIDMTTAREAGMLPLGVSWGFRLPDELLEAGAQAILNHPLELIDYFSLNKN
jgi:phosphoglycolate phosphatase